MAFKGLGICFLNVLPSQEILKYARIADEEGYLQFWLAEGYQWWRRLGYSNRGAITILGAVALQTKRIGLGTGIISPYTRHPSVIAMEAASLAELSDGRFLLGLGATKTALKQHKVPDELAKPIATMRECIELVRLLLQGGRVSYEGKVFKLECPEAIAGAGQRVPIYTGPTGPQMLRLSGELADGVLLTTLITPDYTRYALEIVAEGARKAGRRLEDIDVGAFLITSCDKEGDEARRIARPLVANYLANKDFGKIHPELMKRYGFSEEEVEPVKEAALKGDSETASRLIPEHVLEKVAVVGTPEEVGKRLKEYIGAGITTPLVYHVIGPNREESIRLIAREVIPMLRD